MKKIYFLFVFGMIFSNYGIAAEDDYKICTVGGYFSGASDRFLSGLAVHLAVKKQIFGNPICSAAWKSAYEIGENHSKTGKIKSQTEEIIVRQASEFRDKVYEAISSNINF